MISTLETMEPEFLDLEAEIGRAIEPHIRRMLLLRQITWETRHGVLDGVEIDLRHDALATSTWNPTRYFGSSDHVFEGPCLIFPWSREDWGYLPRRDSKPLTVRPGDRIQIEKVVRHRFAGSELSHPADREFRAAHLVIQRASNRRTSVQRPLLFWPNLSLARPARHGRPTFDRIVARVCDELGVPDLESFVLTSETLTRTEGAFEAAAIVRDEWQRIQEAIAGLEEGQRERIQMWLRGLADDAVTLGYFAAQAEAEQFVEPRARRDLDRAAASGAAGRRSGATRRRRASQWRARATELVMEIMSEPGPHKREAIVFEVQSKWRWPDIKAPGDRSLWGLLKELGDSGIISFDGY